MNSIPFHPKTGGMARLLFPVQGFSVNNSRKQPQAKTKRPEFTAAHEYAGPEKKHSYV